MHTPVCNVTNNHVTTPKSPTKKGNAECRVQSSLSPLKRGKKNTISNLTPRTKPFAQKTHKHFCVKLAVEDAYPKSEDLAKMVLDLWNLGDRKPLPRKIFFTFSIFRGTNILR